jgi:hypothetical protein
MGRLSVQLTTRGARGFPSQSLLVARRTAIAFQSGASALRLQPRRLCGPAWFGSLPRLAYLERGGDQLPQALGGSLAIPELAARLRGDHSQPAVAVEAARETCQESGALLLGRRRRRAQVPPDFDPGGRGVDVLAARPAGASRAIVQLDEREDQLGRDLQIAFGHKQNLALLTPGIAGVYVSPP